MTEEEQRPGLKPAIPVTDYLTTGPKIPGIPEKPGCYLEWVWTVASQAGRVAHGSVQRGDGPVGRIDSMEFTAKDTANPDQLGGVITGWPEGEPGLVFYRRDKLMIIPTLEGAHATIPWTKAKCSRTAITGVDQYGQRWRFTFGIDGLPELR